MRKAVTERMPFKGAIQVLAGNENAISIPILYSIEKIALRGTYFGSQCSTIIIDQ